MQEETGLRGVRIRDARHTYASQAVMNGGGLTAIDKLLGHRKRATTAIFTHRDAAALAATVIARAMGYTAEPSAVRAELPRPEEQTPDLPLLRRRHDRPPLPPWPASPPLHRGPAGKHEPFAGCGFQIRVLRIPWASVHLSEIPMTAVLTKPADRIGPGDIQALIDESVPESAQIEFKESLPAGKGRTDAWLNGGSGIGSHARDRILEEVVAFANAYGGAVVLGIAEDGAKPPAAAAVTPLPRYADLADRFRLVFRECVEPQLPTLDIVPVPTDGDKGVIVFRTGRSRYGPHRVTPTRVCPIRRADRCDPLSMREIQDMTLNLARGTERLERRLRERSRKFEEEFQRLGTPDDAFGFRMTAVPVGDEIRFGSVYSRGNLIEELRPPDIEIGRGSSNQDSRLRTIRSLHRMHFQDWRPMLRAARAEESHNRNQRVERHAYAEFHADGLLEWGFVSNRHFRGPYTPGNPDETHFDSETPVSTLARLLVWADRVRQRAAAPGAEYAIQPQFRVTADSVIVLGADNSTVVGSIKRNDTNFPLYPLEASDEIDKAVSRFERDFWNYFGQDPGWRSREPLVIAQA